MRLHELTEAAITVSPRKIMQNIIKDISVGERVDCHGTCARAIASGQVSDDDIVVVVGPKESEYGFHSIIMTPQRDILIDSFAGKLKEYDKESMTINYANGDESMSIMTPKLMATVAQVKKAASTH